MKIYLLPNKGAHVFSPASADDCVLLDCQIVDTAGFVRLLEDKLGYPDVELSDNRRLCAYYKEMHAWFDANTDNILYKSYKLDSLAMARQMLNWHDELKLVGWNFDYPKPKTRLGALAAIAKQFDLPALGDRLQQMIKAVEAAPADRFADMDIYLPYTRDWLKPMLRRLVDGAVARGARLHPIPTPAAQTTLASIGAMLQPGADGGKLKLPDDGSLRILKFDTATHQDEYLANRDHDARLWIAADTRAIDNRLSALDKPTLGSKIQTRSRIVSLLPLLLDLFNAPVKIYSLIEWLSSPYSPLPGRLRYKLAAAVSRTGGYKNSDCDEIVKAYLAGDYEYEQEDDAKLTPKQLEQELAKRGKEREYKHRCFLPHLCDDAGRSLRQSLAALADWARKRMAVLPDTDDRNILAAQYSALIDGIENMQLLMGPEDSDKQLTAADLLRWTRQILSDLTIQQHPARVDAIYRIGRPGDIISAADRTLWSGVEGMHAAPAECSFLHPCERTEIAPHAHLADPETEANVRQHELAWPFVMTTGCLTLTYALQHNGKLLLRHPLLLRLESQIANFKDFVADGDCTQLQTAEYAPHSNADRKAEFEIRNSHKIQWPAMMNATSLETLTEHPFDFFFDKVLKLRAAGVAGMPQMHTTLGNVAHAVIEKYFTKHRTVGVDCDALNEEDFNRFLIEAKAECGTVFDMPEHVIDGQFFAKNLRRCIESLMEIIRNNKLRVVQCEAEHSANFGFNAAADANADAPDLKGYIDMVLEDNGGRKYIFDFKWTTGDKYDKRLEQNRSIQLAVYQALIGGSNGASIPTAYFLMPAGSLITVSNMLEGDHVIHITPENANSVIDMTMNSYDYRRNQIMTVGKLEAYDKGELAVLEYHKDTADKNLMPLPQDKYNADLKAENPYSMYQLFKGL